MLACFIVIAGLLAEQGYKAWRARRVRYDLTPAGLAATDPEPYKPGPPTIDYDELEKEG